MNPPTAEWFAAELGAGPVPMREVFALAKRCVAMPLSEIERLLEHQAQTVRIGAVSVMDAQARQRSTPAGQRRDLYELYLRRHDRIDGWPMVDRAAPSVVGGYLVDRSRAPLYTLARSDNVWQRRTAIVATWSFIRIGQVADTFAIAEVLVDDPEHFVQTAVGGWVREAGRRDADRLRAFLDAHAATMPRTALRYAVEHLTADERNHYRKLAANPHH